MADPDTTGKLKRMLQGSGLLALCMMVMNVATYGFQIVAAHLLGPDQYGGVASLMALLLVLSVFQLGLQATGARRIAAAPGDVATIERLVLTVSYRLALMLGLAMLLASPLVWRLLRLDSLTPALLVAVAAVPLTIMGGQAGILQGERRWRELSLLYLAHGVPRVALGAVLMALRPTEAGAMLAVAVTHFAPVVVGWWALRHRRDASDTTHSTTHSTATSTTHSTAHSTTHSTATGSDESSLRPVLAEVSHASVALLAFFVLTNVDIVMARNVLDGHEAGLYAAGLILTKATLFLPQFVAVVAFPSMSTAGERRLALLRSLGAILVLGAATTLAAWLLSPVVMVFVGGAEYAEVESRLWLFAILGTALAMLQLLVYSVLARQSRRTAYLIWLGVAALVASGLTVSSLDELVRLVATVQVVLLTGLVAISLYRLREDFPEESDPAQP